MPSPELEPLTTEPTGVTVDLEPKPAPKAASLEDVLAELKKVREDNELLRNSVRASSRTSTRLQQEVDDLRSKALAQKQVSPVTTVPVAAVPDDETQRISELKPWEKPLRQWAKEEADRLFQEKEEIRRKEDREQSRQKESEKSQQFVVNKYPDLSIDDSEITQAYISVVNSHPEWHKDPFGPIRAMLEMERLAEEKGVALPTAGQGQPKPNSEVVRRARATAASLPPGRVVQTPGKVTLTKDQEDFAKTHRIPVETYAKMVLSLTNNGGVQAP